MRCSSPSPERTTRLGFRASRSHLSRLGAALSGLFILTATVPELNAQTAPTVGLRDNTPSLHALTGARVVVAPGSVIEGATVVIRNGVIEAVGAGVRVPAGAVIHDQSGRTLYAGFLDAYGVVGMPDEAPGAEEEAGALNWNRQTRAFTQAEAVLREDPAAVAALRNAGFTAVLTLPTLGIFRGEGAVVHLGGGSAGARVVRTGVAQGLSLGRDSRLGGGYPTSAMGAMAFIRQTVSDADWYDRAQQAWTRSPEGVRRPDRDRALEALVPVVRGTRPVVIETGDEEELLRALRIGRELSLNFWIRGSGQEYRAMEALSTARRPLILPLTFPGAPNVASPDGALQVSLQDLRHWELAPENPGRLAAAGVEFSLTAHGLSTPSDFLPRLRQAVERGLSPDRALEALTVTPARLLGVERTHGTVAVGKVANLVVASGDLFTEPSEVVEVWVDGTRHPVQAEAGPDLRGRWQVASLGNGSALTGELELRGEPGRLSGTFRSGGRETTLTSVSLTQPTRRLTLSLPGEAVGMEGTVRLTATVEDDAFFAFGDLPDGSRANVRATRLPSAGSDGGESGETRLGEDAFRLHSVDGRMSFAPVDFTELPPAMDFGRTGIPDQPEHVLVRNATVWTQGPLGRIENGDLLITRGRVAQVGSGLSAPAGALVIDGTGKHVTPGLIDAHIHAGVTGAVNETGAAIVPEVRIADVLTNNNIWMYRQLSGGLTTAHVMHGSANPIGGQNQIMKLRWGAAADELPLEGARRTVKFALGENVVRSPNRYPNTRMGVEQIIADHFQAAKEYEAIHAAWARNPRGIPPRKDLRMEALLGMLRGEISVQSHSYRQDEILMLIRLAEETGFKVDAFHHGVEAYRVAPEIAAHGAGAVVWSDWSSFKVESYNATTYNARILLDAGVVTSLHSDDSEIASRMNFEAAKLLRTGVGEEEALSLVTSATAQLLGVAERVGSLEPGKDGDFVIWSHHPLSTLTLAEQTWIDGRKYFDREEDRRLRDEVERERARLIQKALSSR